MFIVLDTVLRLGGVIFILFILTGLILMPIQKRFPKVKDGLTYLCNTNLGATFLVIVGLWAAMGAAYTVTFMR